MIDFKGNTTTVVIPGDRGHQFTLPPNRDTMPAKTATALDKLLQARDAERHLKGNAGAAAKREAADTVQAALTDLYDVAAATAVSARQHHQEGYSYATAKFNRAIAEAEAALQLLADHAAQYANPSGIGIVAKSSTKPIVSLRLIAGALDALVAVPPIDA
ncbi:hypothetical protein [Streptomyces sp. NBC_00258]|uniref:hypothetical protein n=1 Tax=Streptomyces sp. NBC_00258 TaxID=2903642 RepID=UPI002E2D37BE|nr:hypothetical protein [Streptomyces sp. NBC_00258]